ncbi:hypothetical protein Gasu2_51210 [Galdieria sulphuraria]|nr:hypothetical protein Gasu2_51210 [Galdieria sulphuraria]
MAFCFPYQSASLPRSHVPRTSLGVSLLRHSSYSGGFLQTIPATPQVVALWEEVCILGRLPNKKRLFDFYSKKRGNGTF